MIYIGIDIAKNTHFASAVNSDGEILLKPFSFSNNETGFKLFLSNISNFTVSQCFIGLESTGNYGDNLICFLFKNNFKIGLINPIQTDSLRNSNIRKTKNDKIDTLLIAKCLQLGNYSLVKEKDINILNLRHLCRFRRETVKQSTVLKTQLVSSIDLVFPELANFFKGNLHSKTSYALLAKYSSAKAISSARIDTLSKLLNKASRGKYKKDKCIELKNLAKHSIGCSNQAMEIQIKFLIDRLNLIEKQIESIEDSISELMDIIKSPIVSIPGIGNILGSIIISEIGDIHNFSSHKKLLAYAGLDPSVRQSGNFNAKTTRISKRGSKYLRYAIRQSAFTVTFNDNTFHEYYNTKIAQGKSHNNALGHVSNKLVRVLFKMLTDNIEFTPNFK